MKTFKIVQSGNKKQSEMNGMNTQDFFFGIRLNSLRGFSTKIDIKDRYFNWEMPREACTTFSLELIF